MNSVYNEPFKVIFFSALNEWSYRSHGQILYLIQQTLEFFCHSVHGFFKAKLRYFTFIGQGF